MNLDKFSADLFRILGGLKQSLLELLPNLLGAFFILFIGLLFAYLARILVIRLLEKVHLLIPKPSIRARVKGSASLITVVGVLAGVILHDIVVTGAASAGIL